MSRAGTVAIDVGGTFTDITFADAATGATWAAKTPSTPGDLSGGFITAVRKVLALAGRAPADVLRVFHGTTTATNAILEGKTPPTALVTTSGFKYVLEIGPHHIPRHGNLYVWRKPPRPITPERVLEVTERLYGGGACGGDLGRTGGFGREAGVVGAVSVGRHASFGEIMSMGAGGASAGGCVIREGRPEITKVGMVGPFPMKLLVVDIHTVRAGGG